VLRVLLKIAGSDRFLREGVKVRRVTGVSVSGNVRGLDGTRKQCIKIDALHALVPSHICWGVANDWIGDEKMAKQVNQFDAERKWIVHIALQNHGIQFVLVLVAEWRTVLRATTKKDGRNNEMLEKSYI
jgi:hypothetical protein